MSYHHYIRSFWPNTHEYIAFNIFWWQECFSYKNAGLYVFAPCSGVSLLLLIYSFGTWLCALWGLFSNQQDLNSPHTCKLPIKLCRCSCCQCLQSSCYLQNMFRLWIAKRMDMKTCIIARKSFKCVCVPGFFRKMAQNSGAPKLWLLKNSSSITKG